MAQTAMLSRKPTTAGGSRKLPRQLWWSVAVSLLFGPVLAASVATDANDHVEATAAFHDLQAAVTEIEHAAQAGSEGQDRVLYLGHRALNDLVGAADEKYQRADGASGDLSGALVHLHRLSAHSEGAPWASAVNGALVNAQVGASRLESALGQRSIDRFELEATDALLSLEMALGRSSQLGTLGGLGGALGTTVLGVPAGVATTPACEKPPDAPAYGVAAGYLVYVALPLNGGQAILPLEVNARRVETDGKRLVAYTTAEELLPALCSRARAAMASRGASIRQAVWRQSLSSVDRPGRANALRKVAARTDQPQAPHLYTRQQAEAGRKIYQAQCVSCHGSDLQGRAAPAVAGNDFLDTAHRNGWTIEDMRSIVFYNMPFNAPGSLSENQYADVMAYLLAENCFPAGNKPFPKSDDASLKNIPLQAVAQSDAPRSHEGVCKVDSAGAKH